MREAHEPLRTTCAPLWRFGIIKSMLQNHAYIGTMYFNKMKVVKEYANPLYGIATTSKKVVPRDRADWIGIEVPPIVSKAIFEKVQGQIEWNRKRYRNPKCVQLLSSLIKCGYCGSSFYVYRRYYIDKRAKEPKVYHRVAYKCNWKLRMNMHSKNSVLRPCASKEITAEVMEAKVFRMIEETMLNPQKLRENIDVLKRRGREPQDRLQSKLRNLDSKIEKIDRAKRRLLELYATGEIERATYVTRNRELDAKFALLQTERVELIRRIPLLQKKEDINTGIIEFSETAGRSYKKCLDFNSKRKFLLDNIEKIEYRNTEITLHGSILIGIDSVKIKFRITITILPSDRRSSEKSVDQKRISMAKHNEILLKN